MRRRDVFYTDPYSMGYGPAPIDYGYGGHGGTLGYPSASAMHWDRFYREEQEVLLRQALAEKEAEESKPEIVLPDRVKEKLEREQAQERANAFALEQERQRALDAARPRPLTDAECEERYGTDFAGLRESVEYWKRHLDGLRWWQRRHRREAEFSLGQAYSTLSRAELERVTGKPA